MSCSYIHTGDSINVNELLKTDSFKDIVITRPVFLEWKELGITNHRRLYNNLTTEEKRYANQFFGGTDYNQDVDYLVSNGVLLFIPDENLEIKNKYQANISVVHTKANEYFPPILRALTNDPGYISSELDRGNQAQQIYPKFTVWLWSRTKYLENNGDNGFINITSDVLDLGIDTDLEGGGTFQIELAPVQAYYDKNSWQPLRVDENVTISSTNKISVKQDDIGYVAESKRNLFYYEMIAKYNDLVFISYEKLKIDGQASIDDVHDKWYDMIGLVDLNTKAGLSSPDISISLRGRDLTKAMMDDNSYFNPYSRGHAASIYNGSIAENNRFIGGQFIITSAYLNKTIQQAIEFVITRIATIGYIPDEVVSQFSSITQTSKSDDLELKVKGIWQLVKVFIDPSIQNLRVVNDNVSNPDGSIYDLFRKIAQPPFVEFFCDTYGDKFYLIFRQPPFTKSALLDIFLEKDVDINPEFSQYKVISDQPSGSATVDQINKYKEIQKKAATKNPSSTEDKSETIISNNGLNVEVFSDIPTSTNRVINIADKDVISDNLLNCNEYYAWFQITDMGNFAGQTVSLGIFPALYLNEYAQTFGNKRLEVVSNYSDYRYFTGQNQEDRKNLFADQGSQHLAFLVETHMYLPFTRKGSITINGDRRIKKGNWIYYRPTNEIYYVTGVSNSVTTNGVDRITNVQVERGMLVDYIKGKDEEIVDREGKKKIVNISYFNLVDIKKLQKDTYDIINGDTVEGKFDYKKEMIVNEDVFDFLLQMRHFRNEV